MSEHVAACRAQPGGRAASRRTALVLVAGAAARAVGRVPRPAAGRRRCWCRCPVLVALVGNAALGRAGGRLLGPPGAAGPGLRLAGRRPRARHAAHRGRPRRARHGHRGCCSCWSARWRARSRSARPGAGGARPAASPGLAELPMGRTWSTLAELVVVRLGGCRYALPMASRRRGRPPAGADPRARPARLGRRRRQLARPRARRARPAQPARGRRRAARPPRPAGRPARTAACASGCSSRRSPAASRLDPEHRRAGARAPAGDAPAALLAGQVTDADGPYGVLDLDAVLALADAAAPRPPRRLSRGRSGDGGRGYRPPAARRRDQHDP